MSSFAASAWQTQVYRRIAARLRLPSQEHEDVAFLKLRAEKLRELRKRLLREKFD